MTKLRWPPPRNPRPRAAAAVAQQIVESDRARRARRAPNDHDDRAVFAAMPGTALVLASRAGLPIDRTGAALSRLKAAGRARKAGKVWRSA